MQISDLTQRMEAIAPLQLAEAWDKVGLQVGDAAAAVRRGLVCIDLTEAVVAEAVRERCGLIVAYHPPLFEPVQTLTEATWKERALRELVRRNIGVYSPHTALDAARGGVNDWLCDGLGEGDRRPIKPGSPTAPPKLKIVTFVPASHVNAVRVALSDAGAGVIGDYTQCSFNVAGEGTFVGGASTNPVVGRRGQLERAPEIRVEMVCPQSAVAAVVAALRAAHPYEEPAFDLVPLAAEPVTGDQLVGAGRVLTLRKPVPLATLVARVKRRLGLRRVEVATPVGRARAVRSVGLCVGAGGSLLDAAGAVDVFITGEMRHHDVLAAAQRGVAVVLCGHTQTERPYLPEYRRRLAAATGKAVTWRVSRADRVPGAWR